MFGLAGVSFIFFENQHDSQKKCTHIFPKEIILDMSGDDSEINIIYQKNIIRTIF